jgi:hypothetical protein
VVMLCLAIMPLFGVDEMLEIVPVRAYQLEYRLKRVLSAQTRPFWVRVLCELRLRRQSGMTEACDERRWRRRRGAYPGPVLQLLPLSPDTKGSLTATRRRFVSHPARPPLNRRNQVSS